jgi:nitrite reductase/ring-hydroxylating ferredoxin subunit
MPRIEINLNELRFETPFRLEHLGTPIVLIRSRDGVAAYVDRCPHAHWPLSEGEIAGGVLHCVGHGWQFDIVTGRCLNAPAYRLQRLPVRLAGERVVVDWENIDLKPEAIIEDGDEASR